MKIKKTGKKLERARNALKRGKFKRGKLTAKTHWLDRPRVRTWFGIGEIVGIVAIVVAFIWYGVEWNDRKETRRVNAATLAEIEQANIVRNEERESRQEERIARAWALVTNKASGNSGKVSALEYLHSQYVPLDGIDLSCATMGGGWDEESKKCARKTFLPYVKLPNARFKGANLSGAVLWKADLSGADLGGADLSGADLRWANLSGASLNLADLSGANFDYAKNLDEALNLDQAFAWDDQLPRGLSGRLIYLCPHELRSPDFDFYKSTDQCVQKALP